MADNSKEVKQEEQKGTKQEQQASKMSLNTDEKEGTMDASVATKNLQNMSAASKQLEENRKKREAELALVSVKQEDINALMEEMELSEAKATRVLRENGGDLKASLRKLLVA